MQLDDLQQRCREFLQQFLPDRIVAGAEDFLDVLGHAVADAGQLGELVQIARDIFDSLAEVFEKLGNALVAAITVVESPINLE